MIHNRDYWTHPNQAGSRTAADYGHAHSIQPLPLASEGVSMLGWLAMGLVLAVITFAMVSL